MAELTIQQAAVRARRSEKQIRRWITEGDLVAVRRRDRGRLRWMIAEADLLATLRARLLSNPARRQRDDDDDVQFEC